MYEGFVSDATKAVRHTIPSTKTVVLACVSAWIPPLWIVTAISYSSDVGVQMGIDNAIELLNSKK
jgi:hypothetical protein